MRRDSPGKSKASIERCGGGGAIDRHTRRPARRDRMGAMSSMSIEQALDVGIDHRRAGRLATAEGIYRQILAVAPRQADALHLLGLIAGQMGRRDVGIDLIRQAIAAEPRNGHFYSNLSKLLCE